MLALAIYPIIADERGEVVCLEAVQQTQELGGVDCVNSRKTQAGEETRLDKRIYCQLPVGFCHIKMSFQT